MFHKHRRGTKPNDAPLWRAIVALRVELLRTATSYGIRLAGKDDVAGWRRWVGSLEDYLVNTSHASSLEIDADVVSGLARTATITEWLEWLCSTLDDARGRTGAHCELASQHEFWWQALERLVSRALDVEELGAQPLCEEEGRDSRAGAALLGGLEDSLVVALSASERTRDICLTSNEVLDLIETAQRDGVWGDWSAV